MLGIHDLYVGVHIAALIVMFGTLLYVFSAPVSRAQLAVVFFIMSGIIYIFGFTCEITTNSLGGVITATKMQYMGLLLVFIGMLFSIQELLHLKIPKWIYGIQFVMTAIVMWGIFTWQDNHLVYREVYMNHSGPFPRMDIEEYGPLFYIYVLYGALSCALCVYCGIKGGTGNNPYQRKRLNYFFGVIIFCWIPFIIKITGITGQYEIPAIGVAGACVCMGMAFVKYSFLDSVSVSMINAMNAGNGGVVVLDSAGRVLYHNETSHEIVGDFQDHDRLEKIPLLEKRINASDGTMSIGDRVYEFRKEDILEKNIRIGKIIWIIDMTDHYKYLDMVEHTAITDTLTGINNRGWFEDKVKDALADHMSGSFFMVDLDNFKQVNDSYGHQCGDDVLITLASVLKANGKNSWAGRIGGDEFCMFCPGVTLQDEAVNRGQKLIDGYKDAIKDKPFADMTSMSVGVVIVRRETYQDRDVTYDEVFKAADAELYKAKNNGKGTLSISEL